jgi:hypothetical protein
VSIVQLCNPTDVFVVTTQLGAMPERAVLTKSVNSWRGSDAYENLYGKAVSAAPLGRMWTEKSCGPLESGKATLPTVAGACSPELWVSIKRYVDAERWSPGAPASVGILTECADRKRRARRGSQHCENGFGSARHIVSTIADLNRADFRTFPKGPGVNHQQLSATN